MWRETHKLFVLLTVIGIWLLPSTLPAAILVVDGNEPIQNMGWPTGAEEVANLPSRLGYMEGPPFGGGEYYFKYHCENTAEFNNALQKFGAIQAPRTARQSLISLNGDRTRIVDENKLLLVVHDQPKDLKPNDKRVDWTFTTWVPENYHRLFNNPNRNLFPDHPNFRQPVPAPRIDVFVGGSGPIVWEKVKIPSNVQVIDKRAKAAPVSVANGGFIRGYVFDMATHQIITDADVILVKRIEFRRWEEATRTKTDNDAFFEVRDIPKGYYHIHICAEGYANRNVGVFHNNGHSYTEFDALLMREAHLRGNVTDTKGNPIPDLKVYGQDIMGIDGLGYECVDEPSTTTDEEGVFELSSLPGGFTGLRCRGLSLHQETSIFDSYKVPSKPWDKQEDITIVMSGTGVVCGKVIGKDGKPPKRAFIAEIEPKGGNKIGSWGGSMQCKKDGSFEFKGVPPGEYIVIAKPNPMREGEASPPKLVTITAGKTIELEIVSN